MPVAANSPDSADVLRLLTHTRRRISALITVRTALVFFAIGCLQALVLIGLACFLHGIALLATFLVAAAWPLAVQPFIHSRYLAGPIRDYGLTGPPELWRLLPAARWGIPLSVLPAAAIVLFAGARPLGLIAFDAIAVCLIAGIWSVKLPTQKRIAWLVDQQAGLEGSLSLWLEMTADSSATAGNPFYSLIWRRVQGHWQNMCRVAAELNSCSADQPRSLSVLIAIVGFGTLAVGGGLLLADSFQAYRQSMAGGPGRVATLHGGNPTISSMDLRVDSRIIHALPRSLAKQLLAGTPVASSRLRAIRHPAQAAAEIRRDIHRRQSWKKTLNAFQAALHQKLASEVGRKVGGAAFTGNRGNHATENTNGSPESSPKWHETGSDRLSADLVQALHHSGLAAAGRNRILAAARGFSSRAGASSQHDLTSAIADAQTAQWVLARELSAEKKLLAEVTRHMAASAPRAQKAIANSGGKAGTALADTSEHSGRSRTADSGSQELVQATTGGPAEKPAAGNRASAALVDSNSIVILDKPSPGLSNRPLDLSPRGGKPVHASGAKRPSIILNKTETALPAGYRRLIRRYFDQ